MHVVRKTTLAALAVLAGGSIAVAQPILETEPNNTMATANFISAAQYPTGAFAFDGHIGSGDVDWVKFTLTTQSIIDAATYGRPNSLAGDSQILLVAADLTTILKFDDDSGLGLFSQFETTVAAGTYYLGITGFDDLNIGVSGTNPPRIPIGGHTENFDYKLVVGFNPIPAPGSLALLGLSGLVAMRRRR